MLIQQESQRSKLREVYEDLKTIANYKLQIINWKEMGQFAGERATRISKIPA